MVVKFRDFMFVKSTKKLFLKNIRIHVLAIKFICSLAIGVRYVGLKKEFYFSSLS